MNIADHFKFVGRPQNDARYHCLVLPYLTLTITLIITLVQTSLTHYINLAPEVRQTLVVSLFSGSVGTETLICTTFIMSAVVDIKRYVSLPSI